MADWARIPSVADLQPQPSESFSSFRIFGNSLACSKRYPGYIEGHPFHGRKLSLLQYEGRGHHHNFALTLALRSRAGGTLWKQSSYSQKSCSMDVLAFGDMGAEQLCRMKCTVLRNISCLAALSKDPYCSNFSVLSKESVWHIRNCKFSTGRKNSRRLQSFGALVDIGNVATLEWTSAVDEILLATTVALAYIAGIFTPRSSTFGRKNDVAQLDNATKASFISLDKKDRKSDVDEVWCTVQQKLTEALDLIENDDSFGTSVLERENPGISNILSLKAIDKAPRLRLLLTTLDHLHKEIDQVPLNCRNLDGDQWITFLINILNGSIGPVYTRWLQGEQTQNDSVLPKERISMMPDTIQRNNLILLSIKNSGKEDLYAEYLFILCFGLRRSGSSYSFDLLVKHAVHILEDLVIAVADGIATLCLEFVSMHRSTSNDDDLTNLIKTSYMSTRALERFRNEVALNRWLQENFFSVVAIYEDRFNLWVLRSNSLEKSAVKKSHKHKRRNMNHKKMIKEEQLKDIVISPVLLPVRRTKELRALSGWRYYYSIFLEFSDIMGPLVRELLNKLGSGISFLLVSLIGRSLGLIYRGIRQSVGWKS